MTRRCTFKSWLVALKNDGRTKAGLLETRDAAAGVPVILATDVIAAVHGVQPAVGCVNAGGPTGTA